MLAQVDYNSISFSLFSPQLILPAASQKLSFTSCCLYIRKRHKKPLITSIQHICQEMQTSHIVVNEKLVSDSWSSLSLHVSSVCLCLQSGDPVHRLHVPQADGAADRERQPVRPDPALCLQDGSSTSPRLQSQPHKAHPTRNSSTAKPSGQRLLYGTWF